MNAEASKQSIVLGCTLQGSLLERNVDVGISCVGARGGGQDPVCERVCVNERVCVCMHICVVCVFMYVAVRE